MEIIRVHIGIYHEIVYSASWFNILNFLGFASEFNKLNPHGFVDYFMINTSWALIIPTLDNDGVYLQHRNDKKEYC